mmetsp:Transcript_38311/g.74838  ORF Transcript_38311/g.74838 Transcript_38311/m.74838 type:complete len:464 (-) Transcript_38311:51-1442(-)
MFLFPTRRLLTTPSHDDDHLPHCATDQQLGSHVSRLLVRLLLGADLAEVHVPPEAHHVGVEQLQLRRYDQEVEHLRGHPEEPVAHNSLAPRRPHLVLPALQPVALQRRQHAEDRRQAERRPHELVQHHHADSLGHGGGQHRRKVNGAQEGVPLVNGSGNDGSHERKVAGALGVVGDGGVLLLGSDRLLLLGKRECVGKWKRRNDTLQCALLLLRLLGLGLGGEEPLADDVTHPHDRARGRGLGEHPDVAPGEKRGIVGDPQLRHEFGHLGNVDAEHLGRQRADERLLQPGQHGKAHDAGRGRRGRGRRDLLLLLGQSSDLKHCLEGGEVSLRCGQLHSLGPHLRLGSRPLRRPGLVRPRLLEHACGRSLPLLPHRRNVLVLTHVFLDCQPGTPEPCCGPGGAALTIPKHRRPLVPERPLCSEGNLHPEPCSSCRGRVREALCARYHRYHRYETDHPLVISCSV